ncbi:MULTISPECIES: pectate lyase [Clostridium]|uniref:Pectate lyase n=1 Tax=Clostridium cibarium TaxID=2762247 RepID=A0ABR8PVP2_9CLOT|nr:MULTISPECIES: pectate lyase [Clostridium]MBD7912252.1 pectate lyase [Clostridium cibarium]
MLKSKLKRISFTLACTVALAVSGFMLQPSQKAFAKGDATGTTASISDILKNQQPDGGWIKYYNEKSGEWGKSTIDNKATYTEIRRLAAEYKKTKNSTYSNAAIKGINFLLNMQYDNGGWPQVYKSSGYHTHITYNDDAMVNVMFLLDDVSNRKGDFSFVDNNLVDRCKAAVNKGVDCILKTQVKVNGKLTAWGQQHDEKTLQPASARAYEVPSLSTSESVGIVNFLKTRRSTPQIATSINAATSWFNSVKITGTKVTKTSTGLKLQKDPKAAPIWARFYEIGTNKPIFVNRKSQIFYNVNQIEVERQLGYAWYGNWGSKILK